MSLLVWSALSVLIHELGHYLTALAVGIRVTHFNMGVGWNLFRFKKFGTVFKLNAMVLGGSIRIKFKKEELTQKDRLKFLTISLAGPFANLVAAIAAVYLKQPLFFLISLSGCLGNLIPIGGSDGQQAIIALVNLYKK
jgi:membrane-associated protease RseP (regulator of RpoE activity)